MSRGPRPPWLRPRPPLPPAPLIRRRPGRCFHRSTSTERVPDNKLPFPFCPWQRAGWLRANTLRGRPLPHGKGHNGGAGPPGCRGRGGNWLRAPVWVRDPALQGPCCVTSGTFLSLSVPLREAVRVEGVTADTRALPGVPVLLLTRPGTIHGPPSARIGRGSAQPRQERAAGPMKGSHHADWQGGGGRGRQT